MPSSYPIRTSDHSRLSLSKSFYSDAVLSKVGMRKPRSKRGVAIPLYTPEERARRDASAWTLVQGVLAPLQFLVFLVSLCLVLHYLVTGHGLAAATFSILLKTFILYSIMITGAIWEKVVFGQYLFARAFFWEDVFSILVLALHSTYCIALLRGYGTAHQQMVIALAAYAAYAINATQFLLKLRLARLDQTRQAAKSRAPMELVR